MLRCRREMEDFFRLQSTYLTLVVPKFANWAFPCIERDGGGSEVSWKMNLVMMRLGLWWLCCAFICNCTVDLEKSMRPIIRTILSEWFHVQYLLWRCYHIVVVVSVPNALSLDSEISFVTDKSFITAVSFSSICYGNYCYNASIANLFLEWHTRLAVFAYRQTIHPWSHLGKRNPEIHSIFHFLRHEKFSYCKSKLEKLPWFSLEIGCVWSNAAFLKSRLTTLCYRLHCIIRPWFERLILDFFSVFKKILMVWIPLKHSIDI